VIAVIPFMLILLAPAAQAVRLVTKHKLQRAYSCRFLLTQVPVYAKPALFPLPQIMVSQEEMACLIINIQSAWHNCLI
jgi:hypothetical protein